MNTELKQGIIVMRAQPFTLGHLDAVKQVAEAEDIEGVNIVIGSSQYKNYLSNPFSYEERVRQIEHSVRDINKPTAIFGLRDFHNDKEWAKNLLDLVTGEKVIFTGNPKVSGPISEMGIETRGLELRINIRGTRVRSLMLKGGDWQSLVPEGTRQVIDEIDGADRLLKLHNRYLRANNTADIIIEDTLGRIALIERGGEPFKGMLALPGGYLEVGLETLPEAAAREAKEEVDADLDPDKLKLLGVYSQLERDPRGPSVSAAYYTQGYDKPLKAGDDAAKIHLLKRYEIPEILAFDHRRILDDYFSLFQEAQIGGRNES